MGIIYAEEEKMMKRVAALTMVSFVALTLGLAPPSNAQPDGTPAGETFRVTVKSSFGTTFTDCFRFDVPGAGDLAIDELGQVITYRFGQLDSPEASARFKAVSRSGQPLAIMFFGEEIEALEQLTGEAVNEFGDTFVFSGPETGPSTSPGLCVPSGTAGNYYQSSQTRTQRR
jgi:hypothetical protein